MKPFPPDPPASLGISLETGFSLVPLLPALASLRVRVFRDWPYLYDGDEAYEADYLQAYVRSERAAIVVARDGDLIVGASTCLPLADETENVQAPFLASGWDLNDVFYFGESVLLPAYRGRGAGVAFFEQREAHARTVSNCAFAGFCGVQRPDGHPSRPAGFQKLDPFWTRRGFTRRPDLVCRMHWRDLGEHSETEKDMVFWLKPLHGRPLP